MDRTESIKQSLPHRHCSVLRNPWASHHVGKHKKATHLIAYVREDAEPPSKAEQLQLIETFCQQNGYVIDELF